MNNIKPSFTKQVWLFKLMVLPLAMSLAYFIVWNVTGDANTTIFTTWVIGIVTIAFAGVVTGAFAGAVTGAFAFVVAGAFAFAGAVAGAVAGVFAFAGAGAFAGAVAVAVASAGKDDEKWKISWFSNIISAVLQFFLTWGGLYVAQHLQITWM